MERQEVQWKHYPLVAAHPAARSFVERLTLKGKRPKTVDAYARAVEDLLVFFDKADVLEATEPDLDVYIASLKLRKPKKRGRGGIIEDETKILSLTGRKLSTSTIAQRVVACRLFYDFLIRKNLRTDPVNPVARGSDGRDGQRPVRGPVGKRQRLPWLPSDEVWERFIRHVLLHEDARTQDMILLAYAAALRREELMSLRVDDIDWAQGIVTIRPETTKNRRMRYIPVEASVLYPVRHYLEGDRRALIAAYEGEDLGQIFLSDSTRNPTGCATSLLCEVGLAQDASFLALTCAWRQQSRSSATADDAVHGAFMTLPPYTRTREGEVPGTSSLPTFAHHDRLARRIKGERASMREGQVTSLEQARRRAVFRDAQQPGSRLLASAHVCRQNLTFQGLDHLMMSVFFGATQQKRTSRSEMSLKEWRRETCQQNHHRQVWITSTSTWRASSTIRCGVHRRLRVTSRMPGRGGTRN